MKRVGGDTMSLSKLNWKEIQAKSTAGCKLYMILKAEAAEPITSTSDIN